jgi:hypothetical protein
VSVVLERFFSVRSIVQLTFAVSTVLFYALLVYFPIYTDEITSQWIYNRQAIDGTLEYLFPSCTAAFFMDPPALASIVYWVQGWIYRGWTTPITLRAIGIFSGFCWILFIPYLSSRLSSNQRPSVRTVLFSLGLHSIGVAPFVLALNRPEQMMSWWIGISLLLWVRHMRTKDRVLLYSSALLMIAFFSCHPKALFFAPYWLLLAWASGRRLTSRLVICFFCLMLVYQSFNFFSARNSCSENPTLEAFFATQILTPGEIYRNPLQSAARFFSNVLSLGEYDCGLIFRAAYDFGWLPVSGSKPIGDIVLHLLQIPVSVVLRGVIILAVAGVVLRLFAVLKTQQLGVFDVPIIGLSISLVALSGLEQTRLFYEARLLYSIVGLILILTWSETKKFLSTRCLKFGISVAVTCCLSSLSAAWVTLVDSIPYWRGLSSADPQLLMNVPTLSYASSVVEMRTLAQRCAIDISAPPNGLILEVWTYPLLERSFRPYEIGSLIAVEQRSSLIQFIESGPSGGLFVRCDTLKDIETPTPIISHGGFCCYNKFK